MAVVFFHAKLPGFSGGFVGVDVFFVISGFLITKIISADLTTGTFSLASFYRKRCRRILPALFLVLLIASYFAYQILLPNDFNKFAKSLLATLLFGSNFYFKHSGSYFDGPSDLQPLLHTWSLSIEEQFYLIMPLVLLLKHRLRIEKFYGQMIVLVSFGGLLWWSIAETGIDKNDSFFSVSTRAWELMTGSLLALGLLDWVPARKWIANMAGVLGLAAICFCFWRYSSLTVFPGAAAILPCFGSLMILWAGGAEESNIVRKVLSNRELGFIGKLSYSLYLWHWVFFAFARYYSVDNHLSYYSAVLLIVAAVIAAFLSYRFVEIPFRNPGTRLLWPLGANAALLLILGLVVVRANGMPQRFPPATQGYIEAEDRGEEQKACADRSVSDLLTSGFCKLGDARDINYILWGDSHASAYRELFKKLSRDKNIAGLEASAGACSPILDVRHSDNSECHLFNSYVLDTIKREKIKNVFLIARWSLYTSDRSEYEKKVGAPQYALADLGETKKIKVGLEKQIAANKSKFSDGIKRTVNALNELGCNVFIVLQTPEAAYDVPKVLVKRSLTWFKTEIRPKAVYAQQREEFVVREFKKLQSSFPLTLIDPKEALCSGEYCDIERSQQSLYRDDDHLSVFGSLQVMPSFAGPFSKL